MIKLFILAMLLTGCNSGGSPDNTEEVEIIAESAIERVILFEDNFDNDLSQWTKSQWRRPNKGLDWGWGDDNVYIEDGMLVIKYSYESRHTSAAVTTQDTFLTTYGYFEASIKIVGAGYGMQSAFWLQPEHINNCSGTGNDGLEIDILESNKSSDKYSISIHHDGYKECHQSSGKVVDAPGIHEGFNTFGVEWTQYHLKFYYNGTLVRTIDDPLKIPHVPEFMILSGSFFVNEWVDGSVEEASLPAFMLVDWVRVTQALL